MFSKALYAAFFCALSIRSARAAPGLARRQGADPQTSLTLDPKVIATGFENDGQNPPVAGQVPSLTSSNNFINFCLTVPDLPITNGKQIKTGSCNPAPIGVIPTVDNMPSSKFVFPTNFGAIKANTAFTIQMAISNLETGNFVNAQANYYAAPQTLNANGVIRGHSHVVIEKLDSFTQSSPTDPRVFAFFKGLNNAAQGGILTTDVTSGLPEGSYRISSINAAMNHQPAIVPVAQRGSLDDAVYFSVTTDGQPPVGAASPPPTSPDPAPAPAPAPAPGSTTDAAAAQTTTSDTATDAAATQTTTSAAATDAAAAQTTTSAAATDAAAAQTTTSVAAAAAQTTPKGSVQLNFGKCTAPTISFGTVSGKRGTFYHADDTTSFPVSPARQIDSVVDFMCRRLSTTCQADQATQKKCNAAAAAAKRAPRNTGQGADVFNAAFGKTTTFKNTPASR